MAKDDEIIRRDGLLSDPILSSLQVLTTRTGTNFLLSDEHASALMALWGMSDDLDADIEKLYADPNINETTRKALIDARRGQGRFRAGLMRRWGSACAVSGIRVPQLLRASHIKPWRDSSNAERLTAENGLLLAANIDALFDTGLISFDDDGRTLMSNQITSEDRAKLAIPAGLREPPTHGEQLYLAHHRRSRFRP